MNDVVLSILSSATVSALLTGAIVWLSKTWISERLKNAIKSEYDQKLETHKAELAKGIAQETESLKGQIARSLEQEKRTIDEHFRRKARFFDHKALLYEMFYLEYGNVMAELYALDGVYLDHLNALDARLGETVRASFLSKAHAMLMQAQEKIKPHEAYLDSEVGVRIAALFRDLSAFMADGAKDKGRLDALALEKGLIGTELKRQLMDGD